MSASGKVSFCAVSRLVLKAKIDRVKVIASPAARGIPWFCAHDANDGGVPCYILCLCRLRAVVVR